MIMIYVEPEASWDPDPDVFSEISFDPEESELHAVQSELKELKIQVDAQKLEIEAQKLEIETLKLQHKIAICSLEQELHLKFSEKIKEIMGIAAV